MVVVGGEDPRDQIDAVLYAQFRAQALQVGMDGARREAEPPRDFFVCLARHDATGNLRLARREAELPGNVPPCFRWEKTISIARKRDAGSENLQFVGFSAFRRV